jgi:carbon monoxide dehydrogenase subunit G
MKIEGSHKIEAPRQRIFAALIDPQVLEKCIPGCEQLEKTGENQYNARLTAGVGPVKGVFTATVALEEIIQPEHYKLVVEGKGQPGFIKGSSAASLPASASA